MYSEELDIDTDFSVEHRPEKHKVRSALIKQCKGPFKRILTLPSAQCVDLQMLLENGNIDKNTRIVVAEAKELEYNLMLQKIDELGLTANLAYPHHGYIEDIPVKELGSTLDFVNYDLCGCLSLKALNWLHTIIQPRTKAAIVSVTFAKSYRMYPEIPKLLEVLSSLKVDAGLTTFNELKNYLEKTLMDYKLCTSEHDRDMADLYISTFHYIFKSIFSQSEYGAHISSLSYNDTRTRMATFFINTNVMSMDSTRYPTFDKIISMMPPAEDYERCRRLSTSPEHSLLGKIVTQLNENRQLIDDASKLTIAELQLLVSALNHRMQNFK
jgi:hypothetical protein